MASPKILIYSATAGYRHDSIPTAITALQNLGSQHGIQFDQTEERSKFEDTFLSQFDALLFLHNSGEVLDQSGKDALQRYLDLGGNFIGIHGASACLFTSDFYNKTLGALFDYHPPLTNATVVVEDANHPSTSHLPTRWDVEDEMYNFRSDPRTVGAVVLLSADETSYIDNGTRTHDQGSPHPLAWYQERLAGVTSTDLPLVGRSWYTSLGHLNQTWQDDTFLAHILGGIQWTLASNTTRAFNSNGNVGNSGAAPTSIAPSATGSGNGPSSASPSSASSGPRTLLGTALASMTAVLSLVMFVI